MAGRAPLPRLDPSASKQRAETSRPLVEANPALRSQQAIGTPHVETSEAWLTLRPRLRRSGLNLCDNRIQANTGQILIVLNKRN